jgi:hypothetical protein
MKKLITIMAAALLVTVASSISATAAGLTLPASTVCFTSSDPYPGNSYLDLTLSDVPAGYTVTNGVYPGWCFEAFNFEFTTHFTYCGATMLVSTDPSLPSYLAEAWGSINYILNNKQGTAVDVQNAIWNITDGWIPPAEEQTAAYFSMVASAVTQAAFIPVPGDQVAVILDLGPTSQPQAVFIEVTIPPTGPGTGTPGYWKNHPGAWPVTTITIGGQTYTRNQAIRLMQRPTAGDKTYNLFEQLVAATLNVMIGNDSSCIEDAIADANAFLAAHPVGSGVRANSGAWRNTGGPLLTELAAYNQGLLCAPHRD